MKRTLAILLALLMVFAVSVTGFASYDPTGGYYTSNYSNSYFGNYYMSDWASDLEAAYEPIWSERPQREVTRGEAFLLYLRAVQRSLERQGYSRLMSGYNRAAFSDYQTVDPYTQSEVNVLYANNILIGYDDNTMRFNQLLTRAEMAAIYSRFNRLFFNMGVGYNQWNYDGYNNYYNSNYNGYYSNYQFVDTVGHWAAQDVATAASNGVLKGVGNGYFLPDEYLSVEQIWKMLDCCVGYQGLKRADIAYAMEQTFKVKFGKNIDESYTSANGIKISKLSASASTLAMIEGETRNVKISVSPTNASYQKLSWSSSNSKYVSVEESWNSSNGTAYVTVYARKATSSYITLTGRALDGSGQTVTVKVKVSSEYDDEYDDVYITSLTLSETTLYLQKGESRQVNALIRPSDADNKKISWISDNANIACTSGTYLSGNYSYTTITGKDVGTTYIYAVALDGSGEEESLKVVVTDSVSETTDSIPPKVTLEGANSVSIGEEVKIVAKASDETSLASFKIGVNDIIGMTGSLSPTKIEKISDTEYHITLMGVEVASQCMCIAAGTAVDSAGNTSYESNEIVIFVNSGEK